MAELCEAISAEGLLWAGAAERRLTMPRDPGRSDLQNEKYSTDVSYPVENPRKHETQDMGGGFG